MSTDIKNNQEKYYYSGGLAELVSNPSALTYSFLKDWFKGNGSLGLAMEKLNMPYEKTDLPILNSRNGELIVNLKNEEKTLYKNTVFVYHSQKDLHTAPNLSLSFKKICIPNCLINTLKIIYIQSKWISNSTDFAAKAKALADSIPNDNKAEDIHDLDIFLKEKVWPNVIAVGLMSEFCSQLVLKEAKEKVNDVNKYIGIEIAKNDWFFRSISDQELVKQGKMSFFQYIEKYGFRSDKDYELASPRWYEIPEVIKERIDNSSEIKREMGKVEIPAKLIKIAKTSAEMQILRSEAKRKTLIFISKLRQMLMQKTGNNPDFGFLTKEDIENGKYRADVVDVKTTKQQDGAATQSFTFGKGTCVSQGLTKGIVKNITDNFTVINEGTIGIFPNASPEFAVQYPKCAGIIFLKGGQTSHGAIVAREFKIPAIIDSNLYGIKDGLNFELNGTTGEWNVL